MPVGAAYVLGARTRLEQILTNLVGNAVKTHRGRRQETCACRRRTATSSWQSSTAVPARPGAGLGSTFTVRLPSVSGPLPSAEEVHELETRLGKRRILVIDDDADILELMRFAVEQRGAYVETVQSAAAALDKLATGRYDVL